MCHLLEKEICGLEELDMLECVTGLMPWVLHAVTAPYANSPERNAIRLCTDMRNASKAIWCMQHTAPTIEDIQNIVNH